VEILNAGCGSGRHPIETAQRIAHARILAVDLSRTSLAYAERKTQELGLQNIEYAHADILQLADIGRSFDVIQSVGVLHHTADPWAAWRDLITLLRPGDLMEVGLYSERARGDFTAAQRFIQDRGLAADPDGIRRARRAIIALADDSPIKRTVLVPDFFTVSGCRDFLFHVEEHQLTISQIKSFLIETGLAFLGFQLDRRVLGRYAARFPEDRTMGDLDCWEVFEQENPDTFIAMYYFWVQKPA